MLTANNLDDMSTVQSIKYASRIVGNLGAPLRRMGTEDLDSILDTETGRELSPLYLEDPSIAMSLE